jgi:hypothetical protein
MAEYVSGRLGLKAPSGLSDAEIRVLPAMPLHAITSVYGEARLGQRLLIENADLPAADRRRVDLACSFMSPMHAADRRQREPYANHSLRVAIRILSHYRVRDPDVACAALLHDTVEDHAADFAAGTPQGALRALAGMCGARTAGLVEAVTNPAWEPGRDAGEQYREHVAESLEACPWARVVKASDFTDNAVGCSTPAGRSWPGWPGSTGRWSRCSASSSSGRTLPLTPLRRTRSPSSWTTPRTASPRSWTSGARRSLVELRRRRGSGLSSPPAYPGRPPRALNDN